MFKDFFYFFSSQVTDIYSRKSLDDLSEIKIFIRNYICPFLIVVIKHVIAKKYFCWVIFLGPTDSQIDWQTDRSTDRPTKWFIEAPLRRLKNLCKLSTSSYFFSPSPFLLLLHQSLHFVLRLGYALNTRFVPL